MIDYILRYSLLVLFGLVIGFISTIPVGAVQLQVVRMALNGHRKAAIATALGSATSDLLYGFLTLLGIGTFVQLPRLDLCFHFLGLAVLSFMLYRAISDYLSPARDRKKNGEQRHHYAFFTGFMLSVTNPSIMLWWIVGFRLFLDLMLFQVMTIPLKCIFILAGCAGLLGYLLIIAAVIHRLRRNLTDKIFHYMNLMLVLIFCILIIYFIFKIIKIAYTV